MSEQPGNGYVRVALRTPVAYPAPEPPSWGTFTFAVIYDSAPPRTALDFVRASNRWPKPYSTALWAGVCDPYHDPRSGGAEGTYRYERRWVS